MVACKKRRFQQIFSLLLSCKKSIQRLSCKRVGGRDKQWRQVVLLGSPVARLSRASRGNEATAKLLSLAPAGTPPPYHTLPYQSIPDQVGDLEQPIIQVAADASCALTWPSVTSLCLNLVSAFPLWKLNMSVHCILYNSLKYYQVSTSCTCTSKRLGSIKNKCYKGSRASYQIQFKAMTSNWCIKLKCFIEYSGAKATF